MHPIACSGSDLQLPYSLLSRHICSLVFIVYGVVGEGMGCTNCRGLIWETKVGGVVSTVNFCLYMELFLCFKGVLFLFMFLVYINLFIYLCYCSILFVAHLTTFLMRAHLQKSEYSFQ